MLTRLKNIVEILPEGVGSPLSYIPFAFRLGGAYPRASRSIRRADRGGYDADAADFRSLRSLLGFAVSHVAFYRDFYRERGFSVGAVKDMSDWHSVPIVAKSDLQSVDLGLRSVSAAKGMKINTGGTSGQPLEFYLDRNAFAREWAHMHHIWMARGYRPWHLKLTFRGKRLNKGEVLRYNAVHNEYIVNANAPMAAVVDAVVKLCGERTLRWLHGYPSLVAEFATGLADRDGISQGIVRRRLFGVLLGSEYPAPQYRSVIERQLSTNVVSWYGHSEMAVLARETAHGLYESLPTYGYAEAVPFDEGHGFRLVCTSLHNRVHPFIRYDTGDCIEPVGMAGGSLAFQISAGRVGDFVTDKVGNRHALTAIIFGRHHPAFGQIRHVQVRDEGAGTITLVVTPQDSTVDPELLMSGFDLADLDVDWRIEIVSSPIRTDAGKIRLKLPSLPSFKLV